MNKYLLLFFFIFTFSSSLFAKLELDQKSWPPNGEMTVGFNLGLAFMQTDLAGYQLGNFGWNDIERARPIVSVFGRMDLNSYFALNAELGFTSYEAKDSWITLTGPDDRARWRKERNLSAGSNIYFANISATFTPFEIEMGRYASLSPFIGGGVGVFHFNPYTYHDDEKIYLQPLQIEGKDYNLWAFSFPISGGLRFKNDRYSVAFFTGWDVTYTDYVDDVSTDEMDFSKLDGMARELGWRTNEIDPEAVMPTIAGRGDPNDYDQLWYFKMQWGITINNKSYRRNAFSPKKRKKVRCPKLRKSRRKGFRFI